MSDKETQLKAEAYNILVEMEQTQIHYKQLEQILATKNQEIQIEIQTQKKTAEVKTNEPEKVVEEIIKTNGKVESAKA